MFPSLLSLGGLSGFYDSTHTFKPGNTDEQLSFSVSLWMIHLKLSKLLLVAKTCSRQTGWLQFVHAAVRSTFDREQKPVDLGHEIQLVC